MADNTEKFSGKAELYRSARPAYSQKLIDCLFSRYGFSEDSAVADVGSGTGIFSKQLLDKGCKVYGVEPNADMRKTAEEQLKAYKNFVSVDGSADCFGLSDCSVDIVTAAQAFHWFAADAFAAECRRVLKGDKQVVLVYNSRDKIAPVNVESYKIFSRFCPAFHGFGGGMEEERIYAFFGGKAEKIGFENNLVLDRDRFIGRCLSASYALTPKDGEYGEFIAGLNSLFDGFARGGFITIANASVAYIGYPVGDGRGV